MEGKLKGKCEKERQTCTKNEIFKIKKKQKVMKIKSASVTYPLQKHSGMLGRSSAR